VVSSKKWGIVLVSLLAIALLMAGTVSAEPKIFEDNPESITGTLKLWTAWGPERGMGDLVEEFNKVYPNVTVEIYAYSNTSNGNVGADTALMAGGQIDVILSYGIGNIKRRAEAGLLMELDELLERDGIDLVKEWGTDAYKFLGKTYSIPMGRESHYIAINMDAWNEAGLGPLPVEWTWDEYLEASRKMTKPGRFGGSQYHTQLYALYPAKQLYEKDAFYNEEGLSNFDDPVFTRAMEIKYQAEVVEKIWFPLRRYRAEGIQTPMVLLSGEVASAHITNLIGYIRDTENYPIDFKFGFAPYPVLEKGQINYLAGGTPFSHLGIARDTKYPEAAWAFTKFFATHGAAYIASAGHMPAWTGTDVDGLVELVFGSEEQAAKLVDVESLKRVVWDADLPTYQEVNNTGLSEMNSTLAELILSCMNEEITVEEAIKEMKDRCDEHILRALERGQ